MAKMKWFALTLCFLGTGLCRAAEPTQLTLANLYDFCTSSDDAVKNACKFYILGVFEGAQMAGTAEKDPAGKFREAKDKRFCVPENLSSSSMELIIKMKMGADLAVYPADRQLPAVSFIMAVINDTYPCHKTK